MNHEWLQVWFVFFQCCTYDEMLITSSFKTRFAYTMKLKYERCFVNIKDRVQIGAVKYSYHWWLSRDPPLQPPPPPPPTHLPTKSQHAVISTQQSVCMCVVVPPVISRPPLSRRVTEGDTARFDCGYTGTPYPHTRTDWLGQQRPVSVSTNQPFNYSLLPSFHTDRFCSRLHCMVRFVSQVVQQVHNKSNQWSLSL